jgi:RHS repeat-associated protein
MSWKMSNETPTRGYRFAYDNLSRLTAANYLENGSTNDHFNTAYAYDKQGNMTSLSRKGNTGTSTYGNIDVLTMAYAGNQLVKAEDTGTTVSLSSSMDFKNNSNVAKEYSYDANGNLIQDLNKGINSITYNLLNLPQTLTISNSLGSATNSYTYAADGRKLKAEIGSKTTEYCGNVIYENGALKRILVEGGYIEGGTYYFYLTDHLGNNRVVADASGNIKQTNHYYPFGMSFAEGTVTSSQPYKYNGKELDTDRGLNLYDYSARYMDPALGRFNTVDPMTEYYPWSSPYSYCANDPILNIDPTGEDYWSTNNQNEIKRFLDSQRFGSSSAFENFNFGSWTHVSDAEFTGNLSFNDQTNTFFTSYGAVENGMPTVVGVSIKATNAWDGGASITGARGKWYERASGRVENVYPEFDLLTIGRGLLNLASKTVAKIGGRVFWSGEGAMDAAMNYAKATNGMTLEMTRAGQNLQKLIQTKNIPWSEARPMWQRLSTKFAQGAKGTVHFFPGKTVNPGSIWLNAEKPILMNNRISIITH